MTINEKLKAQDAPTMKVRPLTCAEEVRAKKCAPANDGHAKRVEVWGPAVPGLLAVCVSTHDHLSQAREYAADRFAGRPDLRQQDVTIRVGGRIVERIGPCR